MDAEKEIARAKRFMRWFVVAFVLSEIVILTLKGIIYLSDRDWWNAHDFSALKIVFFVLHICRMVFPFTLIVKLGQEVRQYLKLVNDSVNERHKLTTKIIIGTIMTLNIMSTVWYNLIIQYYYIIYRDAQPTSSSVSDSFFPYIYYTTTVFNELNFCLLLGMAIVVLTYIKRGKKLRRSAGATHL